MGIIDHFGSGFNSKTSTKMGFNQQQGSCEQECWFSVPAMRIDAKFKDFSEAPNHLKCVSKTLRATPAFETRNCQVHIPSQLWL